MTSGLPHRRSAARVRFDADGSGRRATGPGSRRMPAGSSTTPEDRGTITSALQWFGNVTFWLFWSNGYEPMRALDDNRDGELTGAELRDLAIWHDRNRDGVWDAGEVRPLAAHGIVALSCNSLAATAHARRVRAAGCASRGRPHEADLRRHPPSRRDDADAAANTARAQGSGLRQSVESADDWELEALACAWPCALSLPLATTRSLSIEHHSMNTEKSARPSTTAPTTGAVDRPRQHAVDHLDVDPVDEERRPADLLSGLHLLAPPGRGPTRTPCRSPWS